MGPGQVRRRIEVAMSSGGAHERGAVADESGPAAPARPVALQKSACTDWPVWRESVLFSAAILGAPIVAFYGAKDYLLKGNVAQAGVLAVVVVNVVLIGYIIVCLLLHDREDVPPVDPVVPTEKETNKGK